MEKRRRWSARVGYRPAHHAKADTRSDDRGLDARARRGRSGQQSAVGLFALATYASAHSITPARITSASLAAGSRSASSAPDRSQAPMSPRIGFCTPRARHRGRAPGERDGRLSDMRSSGAPDTACAGDKACLASRRIHRTGYSLCNPEDIEAQLDTRAVIRAWRAMRACCSISPTIRTNATLPDRAIVQSAERRRSASAVKSTTNCNRRSPMAWRTAKAASRHHQHEARRGGELDIASPGL